MREPEPQTEPTESTDTPQTEIGAQLNQVSGQAPTEINPLTEMAGLHPALGPDAGPPDAAEHQVVAPPPGEGDVVHMTPSRMAEAIGTLTAPGEAFAAANALEIPNELEHGLQVRAWFDVARLRGLAPDALDTVVDGTLAEIRAQIRQRILGDKA